MKELNKLDIDPIIADADMHDRTELRWTNQIVLKPGQSVWEYDRESGIVRKAQFEEEAINFQDAKYGTPGVHKKIIMKDGNMYLSAINSKNAVKKFKKILGMG